MSTPNDDEGQLIYVRERQASHDRWHPVSAAALGDDLFRIVRAHTDHPLEFAVGDTVRCERRTFPDGAEGWLAIAKSETA